MHRIKLRRLKLNYLKYGLVSIQHACVGGVGFAASPKVRDNKAGVFYCLDSYT